MRKIVTSLLLCGGMLLGAEERLSLELVPGAGWKSQGNVFWFVKIDVEPTFALWLEDESGAYVQTLFVTRKAAKSEWNATKGRPEAVPVWGRKAMGRQDSGLYLPTKDAPLADALTGATPMEKVIIPLALKDGLAPGKYKVLLEMNIAYDYNETWKRGLRKSDPKYNGENGQPSVVWMAEIALGDGAPASIAFKPVGTGSPLGIDGVIRGLEGLGSALKLAESMTLVKR
jgi:hypothetical protein